MLRVKIATVDPVTGMTEQEHLDWVNKRVAENRKEREKEEALKAAAHKSMMKHLEAREELKAKQKRARVQTLIRAGMFALGLALVVLLRNLEAVSEVLCRICSCLCFAGFCFNIGVYFEKLKGGAQK